MAKDIATLPDLMPVLQLFMGKAIDLKDRISPRGV
jgi:hypothetical protein